MGDPRVPDHEAGEVRGEQPRPAEDRHACVPGERDADDDHGRDPGRGERQPSQQPDRSDPDDDPAGDAEADLADEQQRAVREPVVIRGLPLDEPDHEDRRERVVDPALELEHRLDATAQTDASHGGEDRRGVGRRDDGSDQERGAPVHVEGHVGGHRRNAGRDRHAERREQHRGASDPPHRRHVGQQASLEQDQRERDRSRIADERRVVEVDASRPVLAEQHPEPEEQQQRRGAEPVDEARRDGAYEQHRDADEQRLWDVQRCLPFRASWVPLSPVTGLTPTGYRPGQCCSPTSRARRAASWSTRDRCISAGTGSCSPSACCSGPRSRGARWRAARSTPTSRTPSRSGSSLSGSSARGCTTSPRTGRRASPVTGSASRRSGRADSASTGPCSAGCSAPRSRPAGTASRCPSCSTASRRARRSPRRSGASATTSTRSCSADRRVCPGASRSRCRTARSGTRSTRPSSRRSCTSRSGASLWARSSCSCRGAPGDGCRAGRCSACTSRCTRRAASSSRACGSTPRTRSGRCG